MKLNIVNVNGVNVPTITECFTSANILEVEVGTTGYQSGDTGHGGRTYLKIKDLSSTDLSCKVTGKSCGDAGQIEIMLGGDCELQTFVDALEFALKHLKSYT